VATLAAIALGSIGSPAHATFSGADGRVAFGQNNALWTMNPDGTAFQRVTKPPPGKSDGDPRWSPDGTTIAFERDDSNSIGQIYTVTADGSHLTQLTNCDTGVHVGCSDNHTPSWTPDGKTIVFSHCCFPLKGGLGVGLETMRADGSDVHQITLNPDLNWGDFGPTVSPDGRWVAFSRIIGATPGNANQDVSALFRVGIDGSGLKQLTPYSLMVDEKDWSPNGSRIVFTSHAGGRLADLFSIAPDGSGLKQLTHTDPSAGAFACCPSWSPSGTRIMFDYGNGADTVLATMRPDGTDRHLVAHVAGELSWGTAPPECRVPSVRRSRLVAARRAIVHQHCSLGRVKRAFSKVRKGRVLSERPAAGTMLAEHAKVSLLVSKGPATRR
jgi:Tol biopolymer transport system component